MQIHSDLSARAVVHHDTLPWLDSPLAGVARKMIERNGDEVARATSIVRYAPGSVFSQHTHGLGEEILVLEGTFEDEYGRYGAGTYIKNPPGSSHSPSSAEGCTLFVKLRHMQPDDLQRVVIDTRTALWHQGLVEGLKVMPLAEFATENTALVRWRVRQRARISIRIATTAAKRFLCLTAYLKTNLDATRPAPGCAAHT